MESSSASMPTDSTKTMASGASKYLSNLPSRGFFSSSTTVLSANPGGMRVYICDHDTSPPESQLIKTNQTNILIRSLMLKKQKADSSSKDGKSIAINENGRKRAAERTLDGKGSAKRATTSTQTASQHDGTATRRPERDLQSMTVERLKVLLKEKGLTVKGKKDELIARLKGATG